jgi:hypothetical protein
MKNDGRLGRNYLLGKDGDRMNVILCACGQNFRLLLNRIKRLGSSLSIFRAWLTAFSIDVRSFCVSNAPHGATPKRPVALEWLFQGRLIRQFPGKPREKRRYGVGIQQLIEF